MEADQLANLVMTGFVSIAILVLISIGLAVTFGLMGVINLAHGEFLMLGAFATLFGVKAGLPLWIAGVVAALAVGMFGVVVERLLIRHLYGRLADTMLATWGLSLVLIQVVVLLFGPATQGVPTPLGSFQIGDYRTSYYSLLLIGSAILLLLCTFFIFTRTRYGVMARAAMQEPDAASAIGINGPRIHTLTFGLGAALTGAAGALLAPLAGVVPAMGQGYIARAFMTVIVGGPAALTGTMTASTLLGAIDTSVSFLTTAFLGQAALLVAAIVLLRLMPTGLSGRLGRQL